MELGVFPVRTVETTSPKQVDSGADEHYSNNDSAASKADSGDQDTFSHHMRSKDDQPAQDGKNSVSGNKNTDDQNGKEMPGDKPLAKLGDVDNREANRDNASFVAVEVAMKTDVQTKTETMLAPLTKAPTLVGELKHGVTNNGAVVGNLGTSQIMLEVESKGKMATEVSSLLLKSPEAAFVGVSKPNMGRNGLAVTSPVMLKTATAADPAAMVAKLGNAISPFNGILADGIALPSDLVLEGSIDDLPKLDVANITNFKTVKTAPTVNQPTVNATLTAFTAGLDGFQSLLDTGVETKTSIIGGTESLPMMKPGMMQAVQAMAASQPAATTAAAQLVAAIRTESKSGNIEVRLDPPEMGRVRISLSVETADAVKAVLTVERPETLDHLRRNMAQFTDDLRMAGFTSVDVEFSENGGSAAFQDETGASEHDPIGSFVPETTPNNIVYLSLRENAQLDLLV